MVSLELHWEREKVIYELAYDGRNKSFRIMLACVFLSYLLSLSLYYSHIGIYSLILVSVLKNSLLGRSPGLVVMGGDSCSEGCGRKSQHRTLDGHFSHLFVVKIVMFVWKEENKLKRGAGDGPLTQLYLQVTLAFCLVTSCCSRKNTRWTLACCWLGWVPWALMTPVT